jgi:DHA1 family inner membrane transport protein
MNIDSECSEREPSRLFLPALAATSFASGPITVLATLLLVDIGKTFGTSVSVTGQINTSYSIAAVASALSTSVLSIRFKQRSLLLFGVMLMAVSALGCFLALNFVTLLVFYSVSGAGYAIANPMALTVVGEYLPLEKRASAIGWIVAGGALVYVIGAPIIVVMSGYNGWRFPLLGFVLPILLMSLVLAFVGLPSTPRRRQSSSAAKANPRPRIIFLNRSAVACLSGDTLRSAAFIAIVLYGISFFRQRFLVPTDLASLILVAGALCYVLGSLSTGRFVKRLGRKPSTVATALLSGIFTALYVLVSNVWISAVLMVTASWFFGMLASSANSLTLEQIPELRSTLMSIDTAMLNIGSACGTAVGGLALLDSGYEGLGITLGAIGIVAALVFHLLAKDPTRPP